MRRLGPLLGLIALLLTANNAVAADPLRIAVLMDFLSRRLQGEKVGN